MLKLYKRSIFLKKNVYILMALVVSFLLPKICYSHSSENPSFKYSREANEQIPYGKYEHQHSNLHYHAHEEHGHDIKRSIHRSSKTEIWMYSIGSTLFISAVPFFLLFVIPLDNSNEMRPLLKVLLAFASGGLLGDAFLHLIPHATNPHHSHGHSHENFHDKNHHHDHSKDTAIGLWVLGGIIAFLSVEKLVRLLNVEKNSNHAHSHGTINKKPQEVIRNTGKDESAKKTDKKSKRDKKMNTGTVEISGYLNLAADFAHNFTDGLAIGASFLAGNSIGIVTTVTILLHEIPHEIGDFAILIKSGCSRRKAILLQLLTAIGALTGNALALIGVGADADTVPWVLPFTAGGFIYIATVSVLPELLEESTKLGQSIKEICALLIGVILMVFITNFE